MEQIDIVQGEVDKAREKIHNMSNEIQSLKLDNNLHKTDTAVMKERWNLFIDKTEGYRSSLCAKIDDLKIQAAEDNRDIKTDIKEIKDSMIQLPCRERGGWYQSMKRQVGFMWTVMTAVVIGLLIALFVK